MKKSGDHLGSGIISGRVYVDFGDHFKDPVDPRKQDGV